MSWQAGSFGWLPPGGTIYTDADAINAVNGFEAWDFFARTTPLATSSSTFVSYISWTTVVLPGGLWILTPVVLLTGTSSGTDIEVKLEIDAVVASQPVLTRANVANGNFILASPSLLDFTAGDAAHTFEIFIRQPSGPGQVRAESAIFFLERKT